MNPEFVAHLDRAVSDPEQLAQLSTSPLDPWEIMQRYETRFATPIRQMAAQVYGQDLAQAAAMQGTAGAMDAGGNPTVAQPGPTSPGVNLPAASAALNMAKPKPVPHMALPMGAVQLGGAPKAPIPAPYSAPAPRTRTLGEILSQGGF